MTAVFVLLTSGTMMSASGPTIPPRYKQWLTRDVSYIITNEEKQAFLQLNTDEARDKFIEQFWELRNPTPGAPNNPYKDEIYQRIAYANQFYGHPGKGDGWDTPRGRIYITLGPPQQRAKYLAEQTIRPMEIWFYSSTHPALPPFFSLVFYQREPGDEFRLYYPFSDGPAKLVAKSGTEHDNPASLQEIDSHLGREVARTMLNLLPTGPADFDNAKGELSSDMMVGTIVGLANHPMNKDMLQERRRLLELVSHKVVLPGDYLDVVTAPLVDSDGNTNLHYLLRLKHADDFSIVQEKEDRYYIAASLVTRVMTPDKKPIFSQERKLSRYLSSGEVLRMKQKVFGYEGVLPLPPGKYHVEFLLNDDTKHTAWHQERDVVIAEALTQGLSVGEVVPFSEAVSERFLSGPFAVANVRFVPLAEQGLTVIPGHDLKFFYQVSAPPADPRDSGDAALDVEYAYGRMGMRDTKTINDKLPRKEFSPNGTLITGKKIPTTNLGPGMYRLTVTVSNPVTHERAFSALSFSVANSSETPASWDIIDPDATADRQQGTTDYERGLCYLSAGKTQQAIGSFHKAYQKGPDEKIRSRLVELLYSRQSYAEIADLYSKGGITAQTDEQTIQQMAESLEKLGQLNRSIQLLESAVPLKKSSALYLSLASYYQRAGNSEKAAEMEQKSKIAAAGSPKS
ncbi:MAG TPA: GWxTD domain-containing protein [Terriglobales bacterium]|nr:GWxTD domain-containing protein [Terriglobales bacterium]